MAKPGIQCSWGVHTPLGGRETLPRRTGPPPRPPTCNVAYTPLQDDGSGVVVAAVVGSVVGQDGGATAVAPRQHLRTTRPKQHALQLRHSGRVPVSGWGIWGVFRVYFWSIWVSERSSSRRGGVRADPQLCSVQLLAICTHPHHLSSFWKFHDRMSGEETDCLCFFGQPCMKKAPDTFLTFSILFGIFASGTFGTSALPGFCFSRGFWGRCFLVWPRWVSS